MTVYVIINIIVLALLSLFFSSLSILIIGLLGMFMIVYLLYRTKLKLNNLMSLIFLVTIVAILVAYWGYTQKYGIPYFSGGSDDLAFETYSKYIVNKGYTLPMEYFDDTLLRTHNSKGFLWMLSWLMRLVEPFGGYHTIAFRVFNTNLLIGLGILTTSYFKNNYSFDNKKNAIVLIVTTLFPNALYISIHVFRDTIIAFLLLLIFYLWDSFLKEKKHSYLSFTRIILITFVISFFSYWIRNQSLIFIVLIVLISLFMNEKSVSLKKFSFLTILLVFSVIIADKLGALDVIIAFNERYTVHKLEISDGLSNIVFSMPLFPLGIILRFLYGLITPIPIPIINTPKMLTDIKVFFDVVISYGTTFQILLIPYLFKNIKRLDKLLTIFIVFLLSIIVTTFTFRHFIMIYPFMFILIFRQFFSTSNMYKFTSFIVVSIVIILAASVYFIIK